MSILLVEDDGRIAREISAALIAEGFEVRTEANGETALQLGLSTDYDAVILDLGLPGLDGLAVLKRWRAGGRTMPVLVLSARGDWSERVEGIDAGADDYLPKPFNMPEALARLRAIMRRTPQLDRRVLAGDLALDERRMLIADGGALLSLSPQEYRLLSHLILNAGRIVPQAELIEHLYGDDPDKDPNTIEVIIGRIRRKLRPGAIETRRGLGYVIEPGKG